MWSDEEIQFLYDNPNMSLDDLTARLPGRTKGSIRAKRSRLKIRAGSEQGLKPWTADERRILQENYNKVSQQELQELFPDRTLNSVRGQAHWLRKRGWKL